MQTIHDLLIDFLKQAPFNISKLEKLCGVADNTLRQAIAGNRNIAKKQIFKILDVCVRYGFYIPSLPKTKLQVEKDKLCLIYENQEKEYLFVENLFEKNFQ